MNPGEETQVAQTIEMFEAIAESQPNDYQSLEILKEAYSKIGNEKEVLSTSKRIAQAYVHMGQISSAIMEYETILQRYPADAEARQALKEIETKSTTFPAEAAIAEKSPSASNPVARPSSNTSRISKPVPAKAPPIEVEDGRTVMRKIFVEGKLVTLADFDAHWPAPDLTLPPKGVVEPFVQLLAEKGVIVLDQVLKTLSDKSRMAYLPLQLYDVDMDLARSFPAEICQRWCVLPFDRMSKSVLVATANPYNQQAARELSAATSSRLLWYLAPPGEIVKNLRKAFR